MEPPSDTSNLLLVGPPGTGKTTFLAALWHVVESDEVDAALRLGSYVGDYEYLNAIRDRWLRAEAVDRTPTGASHDVHLPLLDDATGRALALDVPDMSGETFTAHWADRVWTESFDTLARRADGVLFFVHPDALKETVEIGDVDYALGNEGPDDEPVVAGVGRAWTPHDSSAQVVAVDLLQFLQDAAAGGVVAGRDTLSVVVIVSAWDLVSGDAFAPPDTITDEPPTPGAWLRVRLPLLWQFLESNPERFRWNVYGVSAQGGEVETESQKQKLQSAPDPSERIVVVSSGGTASHDITAPVRWLAERAQA